MMSQSNIATADDLIERLQWMELSQFLETDFPKPEDILSPILQRRGSLMVHGRTGIGKTQFVAGLAMACVTGGVFLKYRAVTPVSVLFADFECQAATIQKRLSDALLAIGEQPQAPFRVVTPDLSYPVPMPDLATQEGQEAFNSIIGDDQVIVIDNLSTAFRSGAENDSETWLQFQHWVLAHRTAGRAVVVVQHEGKKSDKGPRGHSRQLDILDTVVQLKRPSGSSAADGLCFEVQVTKSRHHARDQLTPFEARMQNAPDGKPTWSVINLERSRKDQATEMFDQGMSPKDVAAELRVNVATAYRYKNGLTR